jgi:hypothetical protein
MSLQEYRKLQEGKTPAVGRMYCDQVLKKARTQEVSKKYRNQPVLEAGIRFDSKLEARRYLYWMNLWHCRAIAWFTRQVPFYLPGGITYRADFLIANLLPDAAGRLITVEDCKGHMTRVSQNKIKQVEQIYGISIDIITRKDFR